MHTEAVCLHRASINGPPRKPALDLLIEVQFIGHLYAEQKCAVKQLGKALVKARE